MIDYKGYIGLIEFDDEADIFHGEIINIRDVVTFQGKSVAQLRKAFKDSVEEYLEFCEEVGKTPEKPFSGTFTVRMDPETHRIVSTAAKASQKSLNAWVEEKLKEAAKEDLAA